MIFFIMPFCALIGGFGAEYLLSSLKKKRVEHEALTGHNGFSVAVLILVWPGLFSTIYFQKKYTGGGF